jgi:pimeloyl-ACP methyl ester carboxylesterase
MPALLRSTFPDLPGHRQSAGQRWHSLDVTVDSLSELIAEHATGGRAHVIGLSLGAHVGLRPVGRRPTSVDHAVLSGLNLLPFPRPGLMRLLGYLMLPLMRRDLVLRAQARALHLPEDRWEGFCASARAMSRRAFLRIGNELMSFRAGGELARATSPTLVPAGEREHDLVRRSIPEVLRGLPNAQGYLVPGVGHGWSGEAPELLARTVEAWILEQSLPLELEPSPAHAGQLRR